MRVNLDLDEHIVAALPKVWGNELGLLGFFSKTKEGFLALTNKQLVFIPEWMFVTPREREQKYFTNDEAKITRIEGLSESDLDEYISKYSRSLLVPLGSVVNVSSVTLRKVNFLRVQFKIGGRGKTRAYDFGIAKTITSYPIRQPLQFYNLDWSAWVKLITAYLPA